MAPASRAGGGRRCPRSRRGVPNAHAPPGASGANKAEVDRLPYVHRRGAETQSPQRRIPSLRTLRLFASAVNEWITSELPSLIASASGFGLLVPSRLVP